MVFFKVEGSYTYTFELALVFSLDRKTNLVRRLYMIHGAMSDPFCISTVICCDVILIHFLVKAVT